MGQNIADDIYQGSGSGRSSSENTKYEIDRISKCLACSKCKEKISSQEQGNYSQSLFSTRFLDKKRKFKYDTYARHSIHRREVGIVMPTPERIVKLRNAVLALLGKEVTARQYLQTLGLMASCLAIILNARLQMRPIQLNLVETSISGPRTHNSQITAFEGASKLVVTGSQHSQGQIFVPNPNSLPQMLPLRCGAEI